MPITDIPIEQISGLSKLIDRGATVFMAACSVLLVLWLLKEKDRRRKDRQTFSEKLEEIAVTHAAKIEKLHESETARAVKLELILEKLLELLKNIRVIAERAEDFQIIADEARRRSGRAPRSSPKLPVRGPEEGR